MIMLCTCILGEMQSKGFTAVARPLHYSYSLKMFVCRILGLKLMGARVGEWESGSVRSASIT